MTESHEKHSSGLLYFMPSWIFEHADLSDKEKLVYSLLSGLAHGNEHKTCFPSDQYIADRFKISRQTANECIAKLEKVGAISKITRPHPNNPFKKQRIITVYLAPQNIFTMSGKADSRNSGKADSTVSEKADISNKVYSNSPPNPPKGGKKPKDSAPQTRYEDVDEKSSKNLYDRENSPSIGKIPQPIPDTKEGLSKDRHKGERAKHVFTSDEENEKLEKEFGKEATQRIYEILSEWKLDKPKKSWRKNDYLSIRRWVIDAYQEEKRKKVRNPEANKNTKQGSGWSWKGKQSS